MIIQQGLLKADFDELSNSPASYSALAKKLGQNEESFPVVRVAIMASFTADVLKNYLIVEMARRGISVDLFFLPFGQFEQQILDENSDLYINKPDVVLLLGALEDVAVDGYGQVTDDGLAAFKKRFMLWVESLREKTEATIVATNLARSTLFAGGLSEAMADRPPDWLIAETNCRLAEICSKVPQCYLFDYNRLIRHKGAEGWRDEKLFYLGRIAQSPRAQISLAGELARLIAATRTVPKKCLVLDADNTLWGGVIGEDGLDGIGLSESYPGNVFKEFQRYILRLRQNGVILALASKNDQEDVMNVLENHKDCLLKPDHFAAFRINWTDKATNIRELALELNIGLDAMVFVDDNPAERAWVRQEIPEVVVPEMPKDAIAYVSAIDGLEAFDFLKVSTEDKKRAEMYGNERKRKQARFKAGSLDEFLKDLEMTAQISPISRANIGRVVQLINKTNQFNLTVRRHNEADIKRLLDEGGVGACVRVSDRFGDNGLVGLSLALPDRLKENRWTIDTFLLSCRVLGRGVEDLLLSVLSERVMKASKGADIELIGEYVSAKRNSQVSDFYGKHGFSPVEGEDDKWRLNLGSETLDRPNYFEVEFLDE